MAGEEGVTTPIIPGLKIIKSTKQLKALSRTFHIDFPDELVDELNENPMHSREIGINWAIRQVEGLLSRGVPNVHFYIMNDADLVAEVVKRFI